MVRNGNINLDDVKRTLRRYWWVLALCVTVGTIAGIAGFLSLPKRFVSQTTILVEQPTIPSEYVKPIASGDLNRRLASMQGEILSRAHLEPIIEKLNLFEKDRQRNGSMEDLVAQLRSSVKVTPIETMPGTDSRQLPGFYVDVEFNNALRAQQICTEITNMFLQQSARERELQASQTTSFLSQQLDEAKGKLDEQDAKLAEFKRQYLGSLPEEEQANLSLLTGMNSELEANTQALSRAEQDKAFNDSLLTQQELSAKAAQSGQTPEGSQIQLDTLQQQLATLMAHYTPKHPDVIKVKGQIEELKKRLADAASPAEADNAKTQAPSIATPQIQQLRAKIRQDDINIADLTQRQAQIQNRIHELQGRVQASPVVEQRMKELTRNHQTALDFYNDLLKRRENSAMATDLERQQQSEQFKVLDPPSLPDRPSFPDPLLFTGGGVGGGLALGAGLLYLLAFSDKSLYTETDVERCLKLPVLSTIPIIDLQPEISQKSFIRV
jgi:polysaccharide chain length determinant protein (PEP-CTERM system associated)